MQLVARVSLHCLAGRSEVLDDDIAVGTAGVVEAASDPFRFAAALVHGLRAHSQSSKGAEACLDAGAARYPVVPVDSF